MQTTSSRGWPPGTGARFFFFFFFFIWLLAYLPYNPPLITPPGFEIFVGHPKGVRNDLLDAIISAKRLFEVMALSRVC